MNWIVITGMMFYIIVSLAAYRLDVPKDLPTKDKVLQITILWGMGFGLFMLLKGCCDNVNV